MVCLFDALTSHASWTRVMDDGAWLKKGLSDHGVTSNACTDARSFMLVTGWRVRAPDHVVADAVKRCLL